MDGAAAVVSEKNSQIPLGDASTAQLMEGLERLAQEAAELDVELSRGDDWIRGLPHYFVIEGPAHALGLNLGSDLVYTTCRHPGTHALIAS